MSTGSNQATAAREGAPPAGIRALGFVLGESLRAVFYFLIFLPTFLAASYLRPVHAATWLVLGIAGFYLAGALLIALLVLAKRALIGTLETNRIVTVDTAVGKRFYFASMLHNVMLSSPFKLMISTLSPLAPFYYRGMGAKMASSVFISGSARISDPWFLEMHENATVGGGTVIMGHAGDGRDIILGSVFIGEGAIIGARCVVLPNTRIGRHARVGAGAVVVRGTVIPDGETWAGVPARRISARRDAVAPTL